jgi:hypothetical protein
MINVKELRIGNIVCLKDGFGEAHAIVNSIEFSEHNEKHYVGCEGYSVSGLDRVNPIPISVKGLVNLGFQWDISKQAYSIEGFNYVIDFYEKYPNKTGSVGFLNKTHRAGEKLVELYFLHQIQNLFYLLTNKELNYESI